MVPDPWLWPPETDSHGAASFAELTRMVSGSVPGAYRLRATPDHDLWYVR